MQPMVLAGSQSIASFAACCRSVEHMYWARSARVIFSLKIIMATSMVAKVLASKLLAIPRSGAISSSRRWLLASPLAAAIVFSARYVTKLL